MTKPTDAREDAAVKALVSTWNLYEGDARRIVRLALKAADACGAATQEEEVMRSGLNRPEAINAVASAEESKTSAPYDFTQVRGMLSEPAHVGCDVTGQADTSAIYGSAGVPARKAGEMTGATRYVRCPKCRANIPTGKHCAGPECPLKPAKENNDV
jgi:hypothetical protein